MSTERETSEIEPRLDNLGELPRSLEPGRDL